MSSRLRPFPLSCQASRPHDLTEGNKGSEDQILPLAMWEGLSIPTQIGSAPRFLLLFAQDIYWHRPEVRRTSVRTHDRGRRPGLLAMPTLPKGGSTSNGLALSFFNPTRIVATDPLIDMTRSVVPFLWGDPNRCWYVLRARMEIISRK